MNAERPNPEERVLVVAPTQRDAQVTCTLLGKSGVHCVVCSDLPELSRELKAGAGAVILTDAVLPDPAMVLVQAALEHQAVWSDIPTVLLARDRERTPVAADALAALPNVTLLDRPASARSMISAVQSALRSRRRQYQIRDQLIQQAKAEEALRHADSRKDEFLATLAHELRNPLAVIFNSVQVLNRSGIGGDRAALMVAMVDRQSRLLVKLIDELLDVSRITTGKVALQRERLDLRAIVEAALETGNTVLQANHHEVEVDLSAGPVWVVGDRSRLAQVVGNLVNNAAKYTSEGGRISIALSQVGDQAVLRITDNGVGIPAEMLSKVFDMFTQINQTLDRAQGGLGIGLSLVRSLVQLHGGTVNAESPGPAQGSVFTVKLPVAEPPSAEVILEGPYSQPEISAPQRLRILVVDDNPDVADSLAEFLRSVGHQIRTEYGGAEGLVAAEEFKPQVIFCDVGMPGIDGHEVAARLRADSRYASAVLVAVTGWSTQEHKQRTQDAGFDMHLTKPVDLEEVEKILATV